MGGAFPEVVATELRVEAVTVELLPRLRPRLLPLFRLKETLNTEGGTETVLDVVEKVLEEECRFASLSTLVCFKEKQKISNRLEKITMYDLIKSEIKESQPRVPGFPLTR